MSQYNQLVDSTEGLSAEDGVVQKGGIQLNESPPLSPNVKSRRSVDLEEGSDSDESDIIYKDALDIEPFDEKRAMSLEGADGDERWEEEGEMEDGLEGYGYAEPRRVRLVA